MVEHDAGAGIDLDDGVYQAAGAHNLEKTQGGMGILPGAVAGVAPGSTSARARSLVARSPKPCITPVMTPCRPWPTDAAGGASPPSGNAHGGGVP